MTLVLSSRFILVIDVETANYLDCALVYDIGWKIIDIYGKEYAQGSFVIRDTFVYEREIINEAFYAYKIPEYITDIQNHNREMIDFCEARKRILHIMKRFNCNTVAAYNASFDKNALNNTLRYITKSRLRYFFPYETKFVCIWNMACNSICQKGEYRTFAETNRYYANHGKNYKATAETVYAFLTNDATFKEEHKGLDDVNIECKIFIACIKNGCEIMGINRGCWQKVKRGALALPFTILILC